MTRQPRLLDLFCGAGGAAMGYHRAGFDVVGVDIMPQPRYPFEFHQGDAMTWPLDRFDAIHASPPCQDHTRQYVPREHGTGWMLAGTRARLAAQTAPWVIENVPGAPMRADYRLCGCMFNLPRLARERWFETSWYAFDLRPPCHHPETVISVTGTGTPTGTWKVYGALKLADFSSAMGIGWMTRAELSQAIPPAYTEYIGGQLIDHLNVNAAPAATGAAPRTRPHQPRQTPAVTQRSHQ
jgi:DNA (cytosine-5)-methyltransferase 1